MTEKIYGKVSTGFGEITLMSKDMLKIARMFLDIVEKLIEENEPVKEVEE